MIRIVADDKIPFLRGVLEPFTEINYLPGNLITRDIISKTDAILVRTRTKCTRSLLKDTAVRFIGTATIGFDHIDTGFCNSHKIRWTNAPGCNSSSVQQYLAAALLKIAHDFRFALEGKTIGIVGVGNVGSKVEKVANALGMNILLNDPPRARKEGGKGFVSLDAVLNESDFITMHVPLMIVGQDKTYHMINERVIKKMKKGVWFINTSRGEVAETAAVRKALDSGRMAGAVLDVWENEPDIDHYLMHKSFIATPHIAGYSTDGKANGTSMVVNSLASFFNLPLKNWYPEELPFPANSIISINGKGRNAEGIIGQAVAHTYNITEDDLKFRFSPSDFERQRGDYPLRREFPAYSVELAGSTLKTRKLLKELGFSI